MTIVNDQNPVAMNLCLTLFFNSLNTPIIDEDTATNLECKFSKQEFIIANGSMQNGKSPGPDKYHIKFANELGPILLSVYEESFISGSLPETMRKATISLIPKKGKNILECNFFNPSPY